VFVRLRDTSKMYGLRDKFSSLNGNNSKSNLSAEYERNAKIIYQRCIYISLTINQQAKVNAFN
jgi:hypothetical protein